MNHDDESNLDDFEKNFIHPHSSLCVLLIEVQQLHASLDDIGGMSNRSRKKSGNSPLENIRTSTRTTDQKRSESLARAQWPNLSHLSCLCCQLGTANRPTVQRRLCVCVKQDIEGRVGGIPQ
jgi:hypothetical protein